MAYTLSGTTLSFYLNATLVRSARRNCRSLWEYVRILQQTKALTLLGFNTARGQVGYVTVSNPSSPNSLRIGSGARALAIGRRL